MSIRQATPTQALLVNTEIELKKAIYAFLSERHDKNYPTIRLYDENNMVGETLPIHKAYGKTALNGGIEIFEEGKLYMAYPPTLTNNNIFSPDIRIEGDNVYLKVWYCTHNCLIISDDVSDDELKEFYQEYGYYADDRNNYYEYGQEEMVELLALETSPFVPTECSLYIAPLNSDDTYDNRKYANMFALFNQYYHLMNLLDEETIIEEDMVSDIPEYVGDTISETVKVKEIY